MICRKRKLKCDGIRPSCSTCSRLGHNCAYDEQRRKSGPKRGYVKALEERLSENPRKPPCFGLILYLCRFLLYSVAAMLVHLCLCGCARRKGGDCGGEDERTMQPLRP